VDKPAQPLKDRRPSIPRVAAALCLPAALYYLGRMPDSHSHPPASELNGAGGRVARLHKAGGETLNWGLPSREAAPQADPTWVLTMEVIRQEIQEWRESQGPRPGNKEGEAETEGRLTGELRDLLNDRNTPSIVRSLSPQDLDTPFGLAALNRWMNQDPDTAARWIAARPDATDDQAWIVAQKLLEDPSEFVRFSDGLPDSPWKQKFLGYFGTGVVSLDPVLAVYVAQRMKPGEPQNRLLEQAAE
jgi:hypothetical protein